MLDQNTALWLVATSCLAYIAWMDLRPFITKFRSNLAQGVSVGKIVVWGSQYFEVDGESFVKNTAYIIIYNDNKSRKTAKNVRVRSYTIGDPIVAKTRLGEEQVNIHHGEQEWFEIGSLISKTPYGFVSQDCEITNTDKDRASMGVANGSYSFSIANKRGIAVSAGGLNQEDYTDRNPLGFFVVRVSAENLPTLHLNFYCDVAKLERKEGQTQIESPILIDEIRQL